MKRFIPLLFFPTIACAFSLSYTTNSDGTKRSTNPAGDYDGGGSPSPWTEIAVGDATIIDVDDDGADNVVMTCNGSGSEERGACVIYKTRNPSADIELVITVTSVTGATGHYEGCRAFVGDSIVFNDNWHETMQYTDKVFWNFKTFIAEAGETGFIGQAGFGIDTYGALQYDVSDDQLLAFESTDDITYESIGSVVTDTMDDPYVYGFACTGNDLVNTTTFGFSYQENLTLSITGDAPDPPPDPGESETTDYADPLDGVTALGGRTTVVSTSSGDFATDIATASCGDDVVINNGVTVAGDHNIGIADCPDNNHLVVRCQTLLGCTATGDWDLVNENVTVTGIAFTGSGSGVRMVDNKTRFIGNSVDNWGATNGNSTWLVIADNQQQFTEVAYNTVNTGNATTGGDDFRWWMRVLNNANVNSVPLDGWVHHNHMHDTHENGPIYDRSDLFEIGESGIYTWSETTNFRWYLEDNLFDNVQVGAQAILDMKLSGGSVIRRNTYVNGTSGRFSFRIGSGGIMESNLMPGEVAQGFGANHKYVCNEATIRINSGQDPAFTTGSNDHDASLDALASSNIGPITEGYKPNASYDEESDGTILKDHTGAVTVDFSVNFTNDAGGAGTYTCTPAAQAAVQEGNAGTGALAAVDQTYKDVRNLPW